MHVVGVVRKLPFEWQSVHVRGGMACALTSGKSDVWLKVEGVKWTVVWHCSQVLGKPACTWLGFSAPWKSAWWQPMQTVGALL